ncbi:hypothetical protein [Peribacillus simplex]|uniref:hypothetical protein n=1 Tax=Peribacillus simplex TaxID=1478 RepID=UPI0038643BC7
MLKSIWNLFCILLVLGALGSIFMGPISDTSSEGTTDNNMVSTESEGSNFDLKTANGDLWLKLSSNEKNSLINQITDSIKIAHKSEITVGPEYFVEALDAFYGGTEENKQKVLEMVVLIGANEGVITLN